MSAQKGRALLLKIDTAPSGGPTYTTIGGIRSRTLAFNRETVDVTNSDSLDMWRELLADGGVRSCSASGSGVFQDDAAVNAAAVNIITGTVQKSWQIIVPGFGTIVGLFDVSSFEVGGEHNGEVTFSISLESAGAITFTSS